jgi:hypothetical protein
MLNVREWMELVDYKITEGSKYSWSCYGPNAYTLDSWNGVHGKGGYCSSITFSTKNQEVYEVTMFDYTNNRAYRMINPKNVKKHREEVESRGTDLNQAWDDIAFVDLEVDDDFSRKLSAIRAGEDYSTDILVPIDLPDDVLLQAALEAHKLNITLNAYINTAVKDLVGKLNSGGVTEGTEELMEDAKK